MAERRVEMAFTGGALASLGYTALYILLFILMVPAAWGMAAFLGWWAAHLRFSDGAEAAFEGRPGRIWVIFAALVFVSYLPSLATIGVADKDKAGLVQLLLSALVIPFDAALKLPIYRWAIGGIRLTPGGNPRFVAAYPAYLGWVVFSTLSIFTVIGWAWVFVAMARWFCRNTEADGYSFEFVGTGWGLLWRSVIWLAGTMLVIPLPWVLRSIYAWGVGNLVLVRRDVQGEYSSALA